MVHWRIVRHLRVATALLLIAGCDAGLDPDDVRLRTVHLSRDAGAVDVLVGGQVAASGMTYRQATGYQRVEGDVNVEVRAAASQTPLIELDLELAEGTRNTLFVLNRLDALEALLVQDDPTEPAAGDARLRWIQGAPSLGEVDVYVTAPTDDIATAEPVLSDLGFRQASAYLSLPEGTYRIRLTAAGTKTVAIDIAGIALESGNILTMVANDAPAGGAPFGVLVLSDA